MARRAAKAARRKEAKRQRALEKRTERAKVKALSTDCSASAAANRLALLRDAVTMGEPHPPRGVVNLGNTCFFNAVVQCLARVAAFREYFVGRPPLPGEGSMTTALRGFFVEMWMAGESSAINPSALFAEVGRRNPVFKGRAQQDSHELMKVIFDAVVEEEKARLTKVAQGLLPDVADEEQDSTSENGASSAGSSTTVTDDVEDRAASEPDSDASPEIILLPHTETPTDDAVKQSLDDECTYASAEEIPVINKPFESSILEESSGTKDASEPIENTLLEDEVEKPVPPERLVTVIARTVGGLLSSTIVCKECGAKSSVDEPFFDLQVPLVPKDEKDVKLAKDSQLAESNAQEPNSKTPSAACKEKRAFGGVVSSTEEPQRMSSTNIIVTSVPPPPPPPPPPSILTGIMKPVASQVSAGGDLMQELRQNVERLEPESEVEERQLLFQGSNTTFVDPFCPGDDDANAIFGDDDDVEGFACLSSLFDSDIGDENADAVDDVSVMTAYSTAEAVKTSKVSTNLSSSEPSSKKQSAQAATNTRRTSAFFSNLLGGFGGHAPAPHGYKSVLGSLEEFTKVEILEGDNAYGCDECTRREKVRIALQHHNNKANIRKKVNVSTERCAERIDDIVPTDEGCEDKQDVGKERTILDEPIPEELHVDAVEKQKIIPADGINGGELVSSPVTSSESSSGISSEDDGELVIEEEPENKPTKTHRSKSLTRKEEDELVRALDVKVPTVRSSAEKRFIIRHAPEVLLIQLKRFSQFGYRGGLRKISGRVAFPIELDLTPFVEQDPNNQETVEKEQVLQNVSKRKRGEGAESSNVQAHRYILIGVTVHGGSLSGGHYTAYVREGVEPDGRGGWYFCNDSKTSRASEKDVLSSEAYLLYYERVQS